MPSSIQIFAGKTAFHHVQQHGLQAADIAVIPAAAGGPKGLILQAIDQWLFGEWLPSAPRERSLLGASIGAWRMAAASCADPVAAFERLGNLYCEQQYPENPGPHDVSQKIRQLLQAFIGGYEEEIVHQPQHRLHLLTNRGRGLLFSPQSTLAAKAGFAAATFSNLRSRARLARHLERVIIGDARDTLPWLHTPFDRFTTHFCALDKDNLAPALLASGTLPLIMEPVTAIPHTPAGTYWDGGIIDYHLALPYARLQTQNTKELVLYPHFTRQIVPGWLDKALPWRRAGLGRDKHWVDNLVMIAPSDAFVRSLPRGKLPDRKDFFHYGTRHQQRIQAWRTAIAESRRMRDDLAAFIARPDMRLVRGLNF
ncbi:patatin-like phospholipase family protein [Undibacterium griseum]|uniref:Patatin-like phospholipase family protein n=1 Tax=Undibacterium griseum TaxID=2762295 RepID=A0ABR6YPB6_9BURK|nr:patatin-like phospholipase family protein [Undibacterium griseum]MBC3885628.1 patatin-like phospholipase family protein [Undibacterium griseum]